MDTGTVLEIIKMIDARMNTLRDKVIPLEKGDARLWHRGAYDELKLINSHLQSFIEGQLNAFENQSPEQ